MATSKPWALGAAAAFLALNMSGVCTADTLAATPSLSGKTVAFLAHGTYLSGTLTVVGPNGFAATVASKRGLPALNLEEFGAVLDGRYAYQLNAATSRLDYSVAAQNNGRSKKNNTRPRLGVALSGVFLVRGGSIVAPLQSTASQASGDQDRD
jgi:hypothetical protein